MKCALWSVVGGILCVAALVPVVTLPLADVAGYGTVWLAAATVLIWYFVLGYAFLSRWYDDEVGVHLLLFAAAIAVVFIQLLILRLAKGATASPEGLRLVTGFYVVLAFLFLWRAVIFTRAQINARRQIKERE